MKSLEIDGPVALVITHSWSDSRQTSSITAIQNGGSKDEDMKSRKTDVYSLIEYKRKG